MYRRVRSWRRCGVGKFADDIVERARAAHDAAEVEAQHRETARDEAFVHRLRDAVVHRPAALRVWVEDQRNRRARARRGRETAFDAALGAGENNGGHQGTFPASGLASDSPWGGVAERHARLYTKKVATSNFYDSLAIRLILPIFYSRSH